MENALATRRDLDHYRAHADLCKVLTDASAPGRRGVPGLAMAAHPVGPARSGSAICASPGKDATSDPACSADT